MEIIERKIIREVEKRSVLYDKTNEKYKNNSYRRKLWIDISKVLEMNALECQKRWKCLRDRYVSFVKSARYRNKKMPAILKMMNFIKPYVTDNNTNLVTSSFESPPASIDTKGLKDGSTAESMVSLQYEYDTNQATDIQKIIDAIKTPVEDFDSIDYFCRSLVKDLKAMAPAEQRRVKFEFYQVLSKAKYKS